MTISLFFVNLKNPCAGIFLVLIPTHSVESQNASIYHKNLARYRSTMQYAEHGFKIKYTSVPVAIQESFSRKFLSIPKTKCD